ncbi:MAG: LysM peptidoglycan-binding domain-containing protein [Bacteroidota bacterium]
MQYAKPLLFFLLFCTASIVSHAQTMPSQLSMQDTLFIQYNRMGIKTYQHQVRPGQTTNSLKEYFRLTDEEWDFFNPQPQQKGQAVFPSQSVIIPIPNRAIIRYERANNYDSKKCIPIYHIVSKGETFFGLHKRSYNIDPEILKKRNGLTKTSLKVGQRLHIGWFDISGVPPAQEGTVPISPEAQEMMPYRDRYFERLRYSDEFEHSGMAVQSDAKGIRYGYKVYHEYAKIGSCIRITNPARNATVYAEVVGRVPVNIKRQYIGREILAVYNFKIKKALGLVDQQFYAVIRFMK